MAGPAHRRPMPRWSSLTTSGTELVSTKRFPEEAPDEYGIFLSIARQVESPVPRLPRTKRTGNHGESPCEKNRDPLRATQTLDQIGFPASQKCFASSAHCRTEYPA